MQPNQQIDTTNPYAPPESTTNTSVLPQTDSLTQDGYVFRNQLVANDHLKPPLICAKLGTPIAPESNPQTTRILIRKVSDSPKAFRILAIILCLIIPTFYLIFFTPSSPLLSLIIYAVMLKILHHILAQRYSIPLYFSPKYAKIHKYRIITFSTIAIILTIIIIFAIITKRPGYTSFSIFTAIITYNIYQSRKYKFTATKAKGEYLFISGFHPKFLDALPHLPLTSEQSTTIKVNNDYIAPKYHS